MKTPKLLAASAWILLGLSWVMSIYGYFRLPAEMASWQALWGMRSAVTAKSPAFFLLPALQTILFFAVLSLAKAGPRNGGGPPPAEPSAGPGLLRRLQDVRREVFLLALIFLQLVFIHLQTALILLSHGASSGVNRFYLGMILAVLLSLIPYYFIRRRMVR